MRHEARQVPSWLIFDVGQRQMKRDLSLVREILFRCEAIPAGEAPETKDLAGLAADHATLAAHIGIMADAGLLAVVNASSHDGEDYIIVKVTWAGHEFLQSVRDDTVWKKAKDHVLKPGASWTFDILKEWLKFEVKHRVGIPD